MMIEEKFGLLWTSIGRDAEVRTHHKDNVRNDEATERCLKREDLVIAGLVIMAILALYSLWMKSVEAFISALDMIVSILVSLYFVFGLGPKIASEIASEKEELYSSQRNYIAVNRS